MTKRLH